MLAEVAGQDADAQDFWNRAERNLRGGAVRLVFVADVIPDELATVIEFLNTRMHDVLVSCPVRRRPTIVQHGQLAGLHAHTPLIRPALA